MGGASGPPYWLAKPPRGCSEMASVMKSGYVLQLSALSGQRYEEKLNEVGFTSSNTNGCMLAWLL